MPRRPKHYQVERLAELRALASPVREEIVGRLSAMGRASIGDVARALGRKPQALYPHFRVLEELGLVRAAGERPTARRPEALYETPGRHMRMVYDPASPARREALSRNVAASLRRSERALREALESEDAVTRGPRRDTYWLSHSAWVTGDELAEINRHVDAILALLGRAEPEEGTELQAVSVALHPIASRAT